MPRSQLEPSSLDSDSVPLHQHLTSLSLFPYLCLIHTLNEMMRMLPSA